MTEERLPWFPCFPAKLLNTLNGMPWHEGYLYVIVLLRLYEDWRPCKDTPESLARRSGLTIRKVEEAMKNLFVSGRLVQTPDGIINPKAEGVMQEQIAYRERMKKRASAGGKKSAEKRKENQGRRATSGSTKSDKSKSRDRISEGATAPSASAAPTLPGMDVANPDASPEAPDARVYRRGREVFGRNGGGLVRRIIEHCGGVLGKAMSIIEEASAKNNPREWVGAVLAKAARPQRESRAGFAALKTRDEEAAEDYHDGPTIDLDAVVSTDVDAGVPHLPAIADRRRAR